MLFNEGEQEVRTGLRLAATGNRQEKIGRRSPVTGSRIWIDPFSMKTISFIEDEKVIFKPHEMKILMISHER